MRWKWFALTVLAAFYQLLCLGVSIFPTYPWRPWVITVGNPGVFLTLNILMGAYCVTYVYRATRNLPEDPSDG